MTEKSYSLRKRMFTRSLLLLFLVFIILSIGVWHYARQASDYSFDRLLNSASLSMLEGVYVQDNQVDWILPYAAFEMMQLAPDDKVFYKVIGPTEETISGYENLPLVINNVTAEEPDFYNSAYLGEEIRVVIRRKWLSEPAVSGWVTVALAQTIRARQDLIHEILSRSLIILFAIMLFVAGVLWLSINRALEPLSTLSKVLLGRSMMNNAEPLENTGIQEVSPLVKAINYYQEQLLDNLDSMKVFIADASHQIRTVQSATQAQLDIARQNQDAAKFPVHLEKIRIEHLRLTRLTNQLLAHAMVVHRGDTQKLQKLPVDDVLKEVLTECVRNNAHTNIEFSYASENNKCYLLADAISLKEAIRNLLDNAIQYGPDNNHIELGWQSDEESINILIDDSGPGIPAHQRKQALQRFSRLANDDKGSGLGLPIVMSVVKAHLGALSLEASPLGGLRVRLTFMKIG